jgi:hypothetical protein
MARSSVYMVRSSSSSHIPFSTWSTIH